ncbi:kinase-like domain-containing protein [Earliella scabrosa]|nr:kinase-like domain-containing protein [Earliella scabrosa]
MARSPSKSHSTISVYSKLVHLLREAGIVPRSNQESMSSTLGPDLAPSLGPLRPPGAPLSRSSTSSSHTVPIKPRSAPLPHTPRPRYRFPSTMVMLTSRVEGLRHAALRLEARRYKTAPFVDQLLEILRTLRVPTWTKPEITPDLTTIQKVSGSLTNAVFFVSCPSAPKTRTLLLRMYGPSSGSLISRPRELHTLHVLSSKYNIGPRVYGTFENGRVEEYIDSEALTAADIRDPQQSWPPRDGSGRPTNLGHSDNKGKIIYRVATVDAKGTPRVRSQVHRGFMNSDGHPELPFLVTSSDSRTDSRTPKVVQAHANLRVDVAWGMECSQDQFRLNGFVHILRSPAPGTPAQPTPIPDEAVALKTLASQNFDWEAKQKRSLRR